MPPRKPIVIVTNKQRAAWANIALSAYRVAKKEGRSDEADMRDMLTDLLHLMSEKHKAIEPELRTALNNFTDEERISPYQVRRIGV